MRHIASTPRPHLPSRLRPPLVTALLAIGLLGSTAHLPAQSLTSGVVVDQGGTPVAEATVSAGGAVVTTDEHGRFDLETAEPPTSLDVTASGHRPARHAIEPTGEDGLRVVVERLDPVDESITVVGIRASESAPVTRREMDREEIDRLSYGQDVPKLIQYTPSATWYSDSGTGANYSYFSLRGIQQTRINMTFDGAPLNDPAEHAVYFNNFGDFASAVDSIQIQRGVGTSSVGAPSYGGSVNFASPAPRQERGGDIRLVLGSYDTYRGTVGYESGITEGGFSVSGRASFAETDGYRDNSGTEHRTFFLNASWQGERSALRFVSFTGHEETQLAFLAVEPEVLAENRRFNPMDPAERDSFDQTFAQLKYFYSISDETLLTASLYYNGADGVFELWDDPVAQTALLDFGIDQYFVGSMVTLSGEAGRTAWSAGLHYNDFQGDHSLVVGDDLIYLNTGFKETANAFAKAETRLGDWLLYGDLQARWAEFSYDGSVDLGSVDWSFFDPKVGARYLFGPQSSIYASIGQAQREPTRLDLLKGEDDATVPHDLEAVLPEKVVDFELGWDLSTPTLGVQVNLYAMEFEDEIALTGELSDIGLPLRTNVDESYRRGIELDLRWRMAPRWTLVSSANLSRNRIKEWTQYYDVYDEAGAWVGSEPITYRNVKPLLSPETVANLGLEWTNVDLSLGALGRYVSKSQLDNTGLADFVTPSFATVDLRAELSLGRWWPSGSPSLTLFVNNLFSEEDALPSGYSYQFLTRDPNGVDTLDGIPFYYPLALRNVVLSFSMSL